MNITYIKKKELKLKDRYTRKKSRCTQKMHIYDEELF